MTTWWTHVGIVVNRNYSRPQGLRAARPQEQDDVSVNSPASRADGADPVDDAAPAVTGEAAIVEGGGRRDPGEPGAAGPRAGENEEPAAGAKDAVEKGTDGAAPDEHAPIEVVDETNRKLVWIRRALLLVWFSAIAFEIFNRGIAFDRTRLILYLAFGMAAATIGRRRAITVIIDWLPFVLILMLYDWTRNVALWLEMPTHWHLAADADAWMFGVNPTVWLQSQIKMPTPPWWEIFVSFVYMSYFIVPYATAAVLWVRNRAVWRRFAVCFIATSFIGLIGYTLVPAAPPWAAAKCTAADVQGFPHDPPCMYRPEGPVPGNILGQVEPKQEGAAPYVERISARGWNVLGIDQAEKLIKGGQGKSNLVAAIPSLHAGLTMLLALFMWPRTKALGRTMFMGYALVMAFALVYTAEHYVFDILIGWLLAATVVGTVTWVDKRYIQPRKRAQAEEEEAEREEAVAEAVADGVLSR
ncbi:MAG: phosphatase PAP2 family protein [Gordonia sp. (in: high G+C Gram-positive bacteria)]|uniref:phosphatase PAP2 family protein n=1 Tax=Gordonia sp. (in: high G+C Gram-positive bacteria) TaxID=84139 RepID=UPI0039E6F1D9